MFSSKLSSKLSKASKASKASSIHSTPSQIRNLSIGTRTLAKMDASANNKAGSNAAPAQDPKEVLNNPHMLGAQALHKAYNKYNIKSTEPSSDVPRVDHSKDKEHQETSKDSESKA